jgi:hypothetical protein
MMFVSIWFSFAVSLLVLNLQHKRITYDKIPQFCAWKGFVLFVTGVLGGRFLIVRTGTSIFYRLAHRSDRIRSRHLLILRFDSVVPRLREGGYANFRRFDASLNLKS